MKTISSLLAMFLIFATLSCKKSSDPNAVQVSTLGWAVGSDFKGYNVIVHSSDSGKTWIRQGDSATVLASSLTDVCILDENTVLVCGGLQPNGNYTLLKTSDGGKNWHNISSGGLRNVNYNGLFALRVC
ncbi:MAG: hypothetical protein Q8M08_01045 [Bacteroidales bacterium]|nr:hypothetical protein [Bacteroidales bacterium]